MNNEFGSKLKELREKHYPGKSLRRVGEILSALGGFGDYFFTQLHKIESGLLLPSPNLLLRILDVYDADEQERKEIFTTYSTFAAYKKMAQVDEIAKESLHEEAAHQLYRKVKKKK